MNTHYYRTFTWLMFLVLFPALAWAQDGAKGLDERINDFVEPISNLLTAIVFYAIPGTEIKIVVLIIILSALYFTVYYGFINFKLFGVAIRIIRGKYDMKAANPNYKGTPLENGEKTDVHQDGEVSHMQALSAALSSTVGLGNIAGVAVAITVGGPGATFWMIIAGLLTMTVKFVECTLGVRYRDVDENGVVHGGPMYYLSKGLGEKGWGGLGKFLAVLFAVMCIGGSFGGGNMFQANQAASQFNAQFGIESDYAGFVFGLVVAAMVGVVIIGGIKRIGKFAAMIIPVMAFVYMGASFLILALNYTEIPNVFYLIFESAFSFEAGLGGFLGVMFYGFQRAAFSNEAGIGSAPIAHSAVKTKYAASEGVVAMQEPFIDTVLVCTITALVIIVTGAYEMADGAMAGVEIANWAFESTIPGFGYVLTLSVFLFAYSTMVSWSYYGLQAWKYLFGRSQASDLSYKLLFLVFVVIGSSASLGAIIDFSDAMIFAMLFPNMIGLLLLAPVVREELNKYLNVLKTHFVK